MANEFDSTDFVWDSGLTPNEVDVVSIVDWDEDDEADQRMEIERDAEE